MTHSGGENKLLLNTNTDPTSYASRFLSVIIRDCAMHPNIIIALVNDSCYKIHSALSSFAPHSESRSGSTEWSDKKVNPCNFC